MQRVWKRTFLVAGAVLGFASIALNVFVLWDMFERREGVQFRLWDPRDTFDEKSPLQQITRIGSIVGFWGGGELGPQWVRCNGQKVTPGEFPELDDSLRRVTTDEGSPLVLPSEVDYRLPDSRSLYAWNWKRTFDQASHQEQGLFDRAVFALLRNAPLEVQQLGLLPSGASLEANSEASLFESVTLAVRVR